jgi:ATP-binding cassette subfamily B protein
VLIVAQRVTSIVHADKILVMDKGAVVGMGTHQELLENNSVYREIVLSQLSENELE